MSRHPVYDRVKRLADFVTALLLLVVLSPVLLMAALAVLATMGPPVLFRQARPGKDERVFTLYKFRTMRSAPETDDAIAAVRSDEDRLTALGRFLRATSIDELPQIANVLRGEMSMIGPRPLLVEYLGHYTPEQAKRHLVKPGITGWAQVNGRNAASWDDRLSMDGWYAENYSASLDARIALMTVGAVFSRKGVSAEGQATVEPFVSADRADTGQEKSEDA
jgi:lipopolysaccharide/colanic/teichoic acid biosynthesis glycosyltransferase